jgi:hypothetical protein
MEKAKEKGKKRKKIAAPDREASKLTSRAFRLIIDE